MRTAGIRSSLENCPEPFQPAMLLSSLMILKSRRLMFTGLENEVEARAAADRAVTILEDAKMHDTRYYYRALDAGVAVAIDSHHVTDEDKGALVRMNRFAEVSESLKTDFLLRACEISLNEGDRDRAAILHNEAGKAARFVEDVWTRLRYENLARDLLPRGQIVLSLDALKAGGRKLWTTAQEELQKELIRLTAWDENGKRRSLKEQASELGIHRTYLDERVKRIAKGTGSGSASQPSKRLKFRTQK